MMIDNIKYSVNFSAKKLNTNNIKKFSERNRLKEIYNNLWQELNLPQELKPKLHFISMFSDIEMCFRQENYIIQVNKNISNLLLKFKNLSGKNKATLRHEIEHVKQLWEIIRLKGGEQVAQDLDINSKKFMQKANKIEKTFGKLTPETKDGKNAQKFYEALLKYPNMEKIYSLLDIRILIDQYKYYKNILEKQARKAASPYQPNLLKQITTFIKIIIEKIKEPK